MGGNQTLQRYSVGRSKLECFGVGIKSFFILSTFKQTVCRFAVRFRSLWEHALLKVTGREFESNLSVVRIKVGNLVEHFESLLAFAGFSVSIGNYEILCSRVGDEALSGVEFRKLFC